MISRKHKVRPFGSMILTGGTGSILSNLFRIILRDLEVSPDRYDALMIRYLQKEHLDGNRLSRADARAGLSKELLKESMTWKTFIKGMDFLNVTAFDLDLLVFCEGDKEGVHFVLPVTPSDFPDEGAMLGSLLAMVKGKQATTPARYDAFVKRYVSEFRAIPSEGSKDIAAARASLKKELSKPSVSWKTFIKGLVVYRVERFTLHIVLSHHVGRTSAHRVAVSLADFDQEEKDEAVNQISDARPTSENTTVSSD